MGCTVAESFPLPPAKVLRAQGVLASGDFDPAVTRLSLKKVHELRGKLEHWSERNCAMATEARYIDKVLASKAWVVSP